jgi:hypothetical protein
MRGAIPYSGRDDSNYEHSHSHIEQRARAIKPPFAMWDHSKNGDGLRAPS